MSKYISRPYMYSSQEEEIFPLLDAAVTLPYGKALIHTCSQSRASYLSRILSGERYRNAILSLSTYTSSEPLYGRGLYYHLVIETTRKGLIIANVEQPPLTATDQLIQCAATKQPVKFDCSPRTATNRLIRLRERYPNELNALYIDSETKEFKYSLVKPEELIIVDIDVNTKSKVPTPNEEQRAKYRVNRSK